jgi:hypothetical protein
VLKTRYQEVTGSAYVTPGAPVVETKPKKGKEEAKDGKDASKSKKGKDESKAKVAAAPAAPAPKPAAVAPSVPEPKPAAAAPVPVPENVWVRGAVDLNLLEARLHVFSYVGGYEPSLEDER